MRSPPPDLDESELTDVLARQWDVARPHLEYLPLGGGSHHWRALDASGRANFVTVDDLDNKDWMAQTRDEVLAGLNQALRTAATLRHGAALEFVVDALPSPDGCLAIRTGAHHAVSVFPHLEGESFPFGPHLTAQRRSDTLAMVRDLHRATPVVADDAPPFHLTFAGRSEFTAFLDDPDTPWDAGPLSSEAQALLRPFIEDLSLLLARFDRRAEAESPTPDQLVITHGEPHAANTMLIGSRLVLIDWDTVSLAPAERDLWMITPDDRAELVSYERETGRAVNADLMMLYRLRWYLDDLASAVRLFANPHTLTADTRRWAAGLGDQVAALGRWRQTSA